MNIETVNDRFALEWFVRSGLFVIHGGKHETGISADKYEAD